jgi:hypothetical protein
MPVIASAEDACPSRRRASSNGADFWLTTYIGANRYTSGAEASPDPGTIYPMAFLVEQDAGAIVGAHYHQADQFQVVVGGAGRLGHHDIAAPTVHFAGARSPYGPLSAGSDGLQYFTLRNGWDPGARYMEFAGNRATLRATPRRHREATGDIMPAEDGLCARNHVLAPEERVTGPEPSTGAGQFWLVLSGNLLCEGRELPVRSCVFVDPNEPPFTAIAGATGLHVLTLQYPRR